MTARCLYALPIIVLLAHAAAAGASLVAGMRRSAGNYVSCLTVIYLRVIHMCLL
jgi:hypothetical protein